MKLKDALNLGGSRVWIPDCSRNDLPQFFADLGFKVGAEIGVFKGVFTEKLCGAGLKIYAIDPWKYYRDFPHPKGQARLDFLYEHSKRTLSPYDCTIIRKTSMEAVEDFKDESLDFGYIDGSHLFRYFAEDLYEWTRKVRKGGIVSGHDYVSGGKGWEAIHVKYVLNAYIDCYKIPKLYILDASNNNHPEPGKDKCSSWFFFKQ